MGLGTLAAIAGLGALAGLMIGCIGIGGVVLVPVLHYAAGVPIHTAIAAAMLGYVVSGEVGTFVFGQNKTIKWDMAPRLWAGALPGALAGALASGVAPGPILELSIGLLTVVSGINALLNSHDQQQLETSPANASLTGARLMAVGAVTGFGSALTGTGGPLVLIPLLLWLKQPVLIAIGLAQAIQLPIALTASLGNWATGTLDPGLGAILGLGLAFGTWGGAVLAHRLPRATLQSAVAVVLVGVGLLIVVKLARRMFG